MPGTLSNEPIRTTPAGAVKDTTSNGTGGRAGAGPAPVRRRHVRQFSITAAHSGELSAATAPTTDNHQQQQEADDMLVARYILLQKRAIETVQKRPSIIKYAADAVEATEQVSPHQLKRPFFFFFARPAGFELMLTIVL